MTERWVVRGHASSQIRRNTSEGNLEIGVSLFGIGKANRVVSASVSLSLSRSAVSWSTDPVR